MTPTAFRHAALAALALATVACATSAPVTQQPLNSERIQQRYGSYGVAILQQENTLRVACLYSEEAGGRVCRTVAITLLDAPRPELAEASASIRAGASIGATLKAAGWDVVKRDHFLFERDSGPGFAALLGWPQRAPPPKVAVDAYALWALRPGQSFRFARIAEAHHPDYLDLHALRAVVPRAARSKAPLTAWWPDLERALSDMLETGGAASHSHPD